MPTVFDNYVSVGAVWNASVNDRNLADTLHVDSRQMSWSMASLSTWDCGTRPDKRITIDCVRCRTRKPTFSSSASALYHHRVSKTSGQRWENGHGHRERIHPAVR